MPMTSTGYAAPELLVETDWLADHLSDSHVRVIDTDLPLGYQKAHIPGAGGVPHHYLKGDDRPQHVMEAPDLKALMESLGVGDDTLVVAYDNDQGRMAARLWWVLGYYGHANVRVLNGGWRKWVREGRPVQVGGIEDGGIEDGGIEVGGVDAPAGPCTFTSRVRRELLATVDDLRSAHDRPDAAVWDVRSLEEYTGGNDRGNARRGHVPGARHLEWSELVNGADHTFKGASEMRTLLKGAGIPPEKRVYTY